MMLGMHRSGTSALTRALGTLGGVMPPLLPQSPEPPAAALAATLDLHKQELAQLKQRAAVQNQKLSRDRTNNWFNQDTLAGYPGHNSSKINPRLHYIQSSKSSSR